MTSAFPAPAEKNRSGLGRQLSPSTRPGRLALWELCSWNCKWKIKTPTSALAEVGACGKYRRFGLVETPLRSDLYAAADVIVVLRLQIVEITVPHLVGQASIPSGTTERPGTEVADFLAIRRIPPGVEFRIGGGFGDFVAGYVDRRI